MYLNLLNFEYKDYKVDFNKFKLYLEYVYKIQEFALKNELQFTLIGHIPLILLSNKIYRNPDDIDILIYFKDLKKWIDFIKEEWELFGNVSYGDIINMFLRNELQKFASINIETCSISEKMADLYQIIGNNFTLYKSNKIKNKTQEKIKEQPEFIYHDPNAKGHNNQNFIELKDNKFKIWFYTNSLEQHFKSYIIFYDKNFIHKELIECSFQYDYVKDNITYAYWCSPEIDLNKFQESFYRIFVHKELLGLRFKNHITQVILEFYVHKNLCDIYNLPITYINERPFEGFKILLNGSEIKVTYPHRSLGNKYGRLKDLDDYEVYKYLIEKYPLTNQ